MAWTFLILQHPEALNKACDTDGNSLIWTH